MQDKMLIKAEKDSADFLFVFFFFVSSLLRKSFYGLSGFSPSQTTNI